MKIYERIEQLLAFGKAKQLLGEGDIEYARNRLLELLELDEGMPSEATFSEEWTVVALLKPIVDWSVEKGLIPEDTILYRDLWDTKLMGCLTPWPSTVTHHFYEQAKVNGPEAATASFYELAQNTNYIRMDRVALNESWISTQAYGELEVTINLSKPELDPKDIAKGRNVTASSYPNGLLHKENVGYAGRLNHPARQNLRQIPLELGGAKWLMQFSPYVYYHQHAIVLSGEKQPMRITRQTFGRLLEFVEKFPHYFIGSNADLPIVGGSILSHDHYQAGEYEFPMARAEQLSTFALPYYSEIEASLLKWPLSVIRLRADDRNRLEEAATFILDQWRRYTDLEADIYSSTEDQPHNTITPIARRRGKQFELDLVLRNNRTTDEHPFGLFHPHEEVHPIKKENIGLIEVMGLAILPGRLKSELLQLADAVSENQSAQTIAENQAIQKHAEWVQALTATNSSVTSDEALVQLKEEVGNIFSTALSHCGVFKQTNAGIKAFNRFIASLNE
ncbi:UDPglucose--hexose-1-phosphate uridylyltransferase [Alkalicoccobacillus murimartini]|uniref:Galactose-1-phosphate uridylyltransferase n=1 Tax=Alkalicoccobacillus murimartini TaxID=171685 RepID=A0ABT9YGU0_9BACI|nr:UDPglucose--hexose-1-phosphate uridylyltransferase [Alkalicoccobacillus murimartini]